MLKTMNMMDHLRSMQLHLWQIFHMKDIGKSPYYTPQAPTLYSRNYNQRRISIIGKNLTLRRKKLRHQDEMAGSVKSELEGKAVIVNLIIINY